MTTAPFRPARACPQGGRGSGGGCVWRNRGAYRSGGGLRRGRTLQLIEEPGNRAGFGLAVFQPAHGGLRKAQILGHADLGPLEEDAEAFRACHAPNNTKQILLCQSVSYCRKR